jgi:hypothetical protein
MTPFEPPGWRRSLRRLSGTLLRTSWNKPFARSPDRIDGVQKVAGEEEGENQISSLGNRMAMLREVLSWGWRESFREEYQGLFKPSKKIFFHYLLISHERVSSFTEAQRRELITNSKNIPIYVGDDSKVNNKKYWMYKDKLFWENDNLEAESIKALIDVKEGKARRKIEFAKGQSKTNDKPSARFIPDDIKVAVWQRDRGRCVKCGSNQNLEFDHIIPVALGGSSTERNVQLLCERCNREKGADLK